MLVLTWSNHVIFEDLWTSWCLEAWKLVYHSPDVEAENLRGAITLTWGMANSLESRNQNISVINLYIWKNKYILDTWKILSVRKTSTKIDMLSTASVTVCWGFCFSSCLFYKLQSPYFSTFSVLCFYFQPNYFFLRFLLHFSKLLDFIHSLRRIFKQDF